ncbi:MAG: twin-arginine translocation signal domain-containing protein, partial [Candidatus Methanoperedens sp.]|nr:twin-arginine translocation signal domain-containing protein [Candidatus Methanoperedens sp.]
MALEIKMSRRNFLKATGVAGVASVGYVSLDRAVIKALAQGVEAAREDKWVASGCVGCVGWCPLLVRVVNGRAVKITGNPNSVWTRGQICP